jgi:DNA-binding GntR family transcriptional regulator
MTVATAAKTRGNVPGAESSRADTPRGDMPRGETRRLVDAAYDEVKRRILMNVYPGGFQILEEALCEELGMSRTPLREALVRLEIEGLIEVMPRRGVRVLPLDSDDIADIYEVLSALELLAARLIAERDDNAATVKRLQVEVDGMKSALQADDLDSWAAADERFHRFLVDESNNPRLAGAARTLLDQSQRFRMFTLRMRDRPVRSTRSHEQLVAALRRHDASKAIAEHSAHKANWRRQMADLMQKFGIRHI